MNVSSGVRHKGDGSTRLVKYLLWAPLFMRQGIFTLGLIAAVSLPGCTGGNASSNAVTPKEAATNSAIATTASDPSFPGEAAQQQVLVGKHTPNGVCARAACKQRSRRSHH